MCFVHGYNGEPPTQGRSAAETARNLALCFGGNAPYISRRSEHSGACTQRGDQISLWGACRVVPQSAWTCMVHSLQSGASKFALSAKESKHQRPLCRGSTIDWTLDGKALMARQQGVLPLYLRSHEPIIISSSIFIGNPMSAFGWRVGSTRAFGIPATCRQLCPHEGFFDPCDPVTTTLFA